ncbi:MAG: tRNA dihydrouridine(20/20a) synthase DusA [Rhodobacteraceae bacterium]|nr:tRNA dihydrouridine(20/20a) synthase DusA [Paracoccaceae bacterium]
MAGARPARLSVAPMMGWTDRHCRQFHRLLSADALLYTEMVAAAALVHGDRARLLGFEAAHQPVALQLGGADPALLARATAIAAGAGYREVNLNVGCPSDRVQSGAFGAALMRHPALVGDCVAAMIAAAGGEAEVTVKCRLGVDEQDPAEALPALLAAVAGAGVRRVVVHARKAWLAGLSPKENRTIPPLDHDLVLALKPAFPGLALVLNGGIESLEMAAGFLARGSDGVMVGRAAYHHPLAILGPADGLAGGARRPPPEPLAVGRAMRPWIADHLAAGGRVHDVTRHMAGLFALRPGARRWRQFLAGPGPRDLAAYDAALAAAAAAGGEGDAAGARASAAA